MGTTKPFTAILHYSAPPVVGGVEAVMLAHARTFLQFDYPVAMVAGQGTAAALPPSCDLILIPELDSQHPAVLAVGEELAQGRVPEEFGALRAQLRVTLADKLGKYDNVIVHNVFTKHFNLPLTAALFDLLDEGLIKNCIAWHHDFTWTSPRSRSKVHDGYPWDLLRTYRGDITHVTISQQRRAELAGLYGRPQAGIEVIYNGVDAAQLLGLSAEGWDLVQRLDLFVADVILLMPVRVTRAKNIEYALEVVATMKKEGVRVKLVLSGPPDPHDENSMAYFRALQDKRDELGLGDAFHFVYESGPDLREAYQIDLDVVADLYRAADVLFMPSHQEGFGMPILEAGLLGLPIVASQAVPAAEEIAGVDAAICFDPDLPTQELARQIMRFVREDERLSLARRVRKNYTWEALFKQQIEPLLNQRRVDDLV